MAKISMIFRDVLRSKIVKQYKAKRLALKETIQNIHLDYDERMVAQQKLQDLPRDASPTRQRRRCAKCGRSRGVYRKFGLCRIHLREYAMDAKVPGITKASW